MHYLYAGEKQLTALREAVKNQGLVDVEVKQPFMGRVVVWCGSDHSREVLAAVIASTEVMAD